VDKDLDLWIFYQSRKYSEFNHFRLHLLQLKIVFS